MGDTEKTVQKRTRNKNFRKAILGTVAMTGVISVALVAPNVIGALGKLGYLPSKRDGDSITRARKRLVEKGLLRYENGILHITPAGEKTLRQLEISNFQQKKPRQWDKKWRVLIFDIPEKRKVMREKVRLTITAIGFERLQDSVWIFPYNCEDLITLLKADFKIGKDMLYLIVDHFEGDVEIKKKFNLS